MILLLVLAVRRSHCIVSRVSMMCCILRFVSLFVVLAAVCSSASNHHRSSRHRKSEDVTTPPTTTTTTITNTNENEYIAILNLLDFGADPTGTILSNPAFDFVFQAAASQQMNSNSNSNGMVQIIVPTGIYLLRPIQLSYSNIHLHLEENVILRSSTSLPTTMPPPQSHSKEDTTHNEEVPYIERTYDNTNDDDRIYHPLRKQHYHSEFDYDIDTSTATATNHHHAAAALLPLEDPYLHWPITPALQTFGGGREDGRPMRYEAFFSITHVDNVILSGTSTSHNSSRIEGGGLAWWKLYANHANHHTLLPYTRPSLLEIRHSTNIQVHHIQLTQSPFWTMHLYNSSAIVIHHVQIQNDIAGYDPDTNRTYSSANVDGIDINSCFNVSIYESHIQTHDDSIVIKSGLDLAGLKTNLSSHDIRIYNCYVSSPVGAGLGIGSEVSGGIYNIVFHNITIYRSLFGVRIKTSHGRGSYVQNVVFTDLHLFYNTNAQYGPTSTIVISMFGGDRPHFLKGYHWDDITMIQNITFDNVTMYNDPFAVPVHNNNNNNQNNINNNHHDTKNPQEDNDLLSISELLSDIVSTTNTATTIIPATPKNHNSHLLSSSSRIHNDAHGIHITGDTNLRRYWSLHFFRQKSQAPPHYNDYIRNISFIHINNFITTPEISTTIANTLTVPGPQDSNGVPLVDPHHQRNQELQNFDCSNAIHISYNDFTDITCRDQPYVMFWYDFNQLKRVIQKLFQ